MRSIRERILHGSDEKQDTKKQDIPEKWLESPWVKGSGYFVATLAVLWASGIFFSALGFSVKSFKEFIKKSKGA